jgi:hypothetical protein
VETCATCGHTLPPVGRYCTNCGARHAPAGGTPAGGAAPPPPVDVEPEAGRGRDEAPPPDHGLVPPDDPGWLLDPAPDDLPEERPPVSLPILGILVALALIAIIGAALLLASRSGGEGRATDPGGGASVVEVAADADSEGASPSPEPDAETSATNVVDRSDGPRGKPREIRTRASVEVGYGKRLAGGPDWYAGNRRIQSARWQLDDGDVTLVGIPG